MLDGSEWRWGGGLRRERESQLVRGWMRGIPVSSPDRERTGHPGGKVIQQREGGCDPAWSPARVLADQSHARPLSRQPPSQPPDLQRRLLMRECISGASIVMRPEWGRGDMGPLRCRLRRWTKAGRSAGRAEQVDPVGSQPRPPVSKLPDPAESQTASGEKQSVEQGSLWDVERTDRPSPRCWRALPEREFQRRVQSA